MNQITTEISGKWVHNQAEFFILGHFNSFFLQLIALKWYLLGWGGWCVV